MRLPWQKRKPFFTKEEQQQIVVAIRHAERLTSGEVRVFVESKCTYLDALDRATELFFKLQMDETEDRNGVLVYVAVKDKQLAIFGDRGIHQKVGSAWWEKEVEKMIQDIYRNNISAGICDIVSDIGKALQAYFPFDKGTDRNELPDEIVFGK
ncbi:MAG: TPM domain-containing protein [Bacteroidetes bacterium]|nr:TPM domain-containing protein [Bacteroidota bacterium]